MSAFGINDLPAADAPHNTSLAQEDATQANKIHTDEDIKSQVEMKFVHMFELFLFGNGSHKVVPLTWLVLITAVVLYLHIIYFKTVGLSNSRGYFIVLLHDLYLVSMVANFSFSWKFLHARLNAERTIRENCNTAEARHTARQMLEKMTRGVYLLFVLFFGIYMLSPGVFSTATLYAVDSAALGLSSTDLPMAMLIFTLLAGYIFYNASFYVCIIWIWKCWLKHMVHVGMADSVSYASVLDDSFVEEFRKSYTLNSIQSNDWNVNHIIRVVTCIPVAYIIVANGAFLGGMKGKALVFMGFLFYGLVWFSVAAGGFVNDKGYMLCVEKVGSIAYQKDASLNEEENLRASNMFRFRRMEVLMRMEIIKSTNGIKFAGILLTVQKAVAVGSILLTFISMDVDLLGASSTGYDAEAE